MGVDTKVGKYNTYLSEYLDWGGIIQKKKSEEFVVPIIIWNHIQPKYFE